MSKNINKIRKVRRAKELSQEYMAFELDISQKAYSDIECGKTKLKNETLMKISNILEVSPSEICPLSFECSYRKEIKDKHHLLVEYLLKNDIDFPSEYI